MDCAARGCHGHVAVNSCFSALGGGAIYAGMITQKLFAKYVK